MRTPLRKLLKHPPKRDRSKCASLHCGHSRERHMPSPVNYGMRRGACRVEGCLCRLYTSFPKRTRKPRSWLYRAKPIRKLPKKAVQPTPTGDYFVGDEFDKPASR